jgi:D-alanine transaminase
MPELVFLNGEISDFASAKVSVEDRGFQFGDGIYEVVRCYNGVPFALAAHIERLRQGAQVIELESIPGQGEFITIIQNLLAQSGIKEGELYIQLTRGATRRSHLVSGIPPTVLVSIRQVRTIDPALRKKGASAITVPDDRWDRCHVKSICLLANILAKRQAYRAGAFEAIFVRNGIVTEGSSSNIFLYMGDKTLITPPVDYRILPGITREYIVSIARALGLAVAEREISIDELPRAEEIFITSTTMEMLALVNIDDLRIGTGRPGPVLRQLHDAYRAQTAAIIKDEG